MTPQDLRKLRTEAGLSQQALATMLGVETSTVVRLEAGRLPLSKRWQSHLELLFMGLAACAEYERKEATPQAGSQPQ